MRARSRTWPALVLAGAVAGAVAAVVAVVVLGVAQPAAQAHEPFEITTDARIGPGHLDLHVLLAADTAAKICFGERAPERRELKEGGAEAFAKLQARFVTCAGRFYEVKDNDRILSLRTATARLTDEEDVDFRLGYPEPPPGVLRLDAVHLNRLGDGTYGALVTVTGDRTFFGQKLLRGGDPAARVIEVKVGKAGKAYGWWRAQVNADAGVGTGADGGAAGAATDGPGSKRRRQRRPHPSRRRASSWCSASSTS